MTLTVGNIPIHPYKTTIELPDDLLIEAKQVAARRRTTLKEMLTRSLCREIGCDDPPPPAADSAFEIGMLGLPVLKRTGKCLSVAEFQQIIDAMDEHDDQHGNQGAFPPANQPRHLP